jgi:hypothetical protein
MGLHKIHPSKAGNWGYLGDIDICIGLRPTQLQADLVLLSTRELSGYCLRHLCSHVCTLSASRWLAA